MDTKAEQDAKLDEALRESFPASDAPATLSELEPDDLNKRHIAIIVGSLRKGAYSRKIAHALMEVAPDELQLEIVEIGELPLFNQDLEETPPSAWIEFRDRIRPVHAVLFVAPEYNRSMPGALKNAIDVGSRPPGNDVWDGKPGGVVSTSPGALGGISSNNHLRQSLAAVNISVMPQPNVSIGQVHRLLDESGELVDDRTRQFLQKFMTGFAVWIEKQLG